MEWAAFFASHKRNMSAHGLICTHFPSWTFALFLSPISGFNLRQFPPVSHSLQLPTRKYTRYANGCLYLSNQGPNPQQEKYFKPDTYHGLLWQVANDKDHPSEKETGTNTDRFILFLNLHDANTPSLPLECDRQTSGNQTTGNVSIGQAERKKSRSSCSGWLVWKSQMKFLSISTLEGRDLESLRASSDRLYTQKGWAIESVNIHLHFQRADSETLLWRFTEVRGYGSWIGSEICKYCFS